MKTPGFLRELRSLLRLALPIIVSQLGQVGMNTADTIMVGPLGATPLAAAGLGSAIHFFGIVFSIGVIVGVGPLMSQAFGAGLLDRCRYALVQALWVAALLSIPVGWLNFVGGAVAQGLGQETGIAELAGQYMRALTWGVLPFFLFTAFRQYLESMGRPSAPMLVTFFGLAINIVANRMLIYGVEDWIPAMGVVGSGWATTIVRWAMLAAILIYVAAHPRLRPFRGIRLRPDRVMMKRIVVIGGPIGGQFGLEVGLFSFAAVMMGWLGPVELAAHQVTINIASTTFMVALGTSMAGAIRIGHHIGARDAHSMRHAVLGTYLLAGGIMALFAILFLTIPRSLINLYTSDPGIIDLGSRLILVAAAFQVFDGAQVAGVSVLRGAAETRTSAIIAAVGYWVLGVPIGWILAFQTGLGPIGVWIGLTTGLAAAAVGLALWARRVLWQTPIDLLHAGD